MKRLEKERRKWQKKYPKEEPQPLPKFDLVRYDDYRHYPPVQSLERLIENIKKLLSKRKCNTILFDNPMATGLNDADIITELNNRLIDNPEMELPSGFEKKQQLKVEFVHHLPLNLPVEESFRVVYSTVDQILFDIFEFHIIEPIALQQSVIEAKPILRKAKQKKVKSTYMDVDGYMKRLEERAMKRRAIDKRSF